ncbi:MAG: TonB-dependent receptor [Paludibacter sp.]|nr:TonB-dependent receptor [Paludibacter sp.]MDD4427729.1 TonB-dependent receptor [Paludibacter sp.]
MKKSILFLMLFGCLISAFSQPKSTISGVITDNENLPLPGVNVVLKGTNTGTISNIDGYYTITVPASSGTTLVFSFVGYDSKEIAVNGQSVIDVVLGNSSVELNEIVKIGYATTKRKDLTGSVSSLKSSDLVGTPITDVTQALSGKIAGVQVIKSQGAPDAETSIRVRGGTSITQNNEPLYIIDGFPSEDGLKGIEATDIETIDVLKDASSTAIYGSRGANGVILITTKGGKENKMTIDYDVYAGLKKITKKYDLLNVRDFVELEYERAINDPDKMRTTILPTYGEFNEYESLYGNRPGIDWQDEVFNRRPAVTQQHKVNISGGNKTSQYLFSYTHNDDKGIWYGSSLVRDNVRIKLNQKTTDWMNVSLNVNYIDEKTQGLGSLQDGGAFSRMQHVIQYRPTIGKNGQDEGLIINDDDPLLLLEGASPMQSPIASIEGETKNKRNRILNLNGDVEIKLLKNLSYRGSLGVRKRLYNQDIFYSERSKQAKNAGAPYGWKVIDDAESMMFNNVLSYSKTINSVNQLDLIAGQEYLFDRFSYLKAGAANFPDINFGLNDMSLGGTPEIPVTSIAENKLLSFFTRANVNINQKYLLAASIRADGSTKFGANHKWGYFPSASFAWRMSEEDFLKEQDLLSNLKLRLSYGTSGNNRIDNYLSLSLLGTLWIPSGNGTLPGLGSRQLENPDLKWETNITGNFGIDAGFLDNRIQVTLDLYNTDTKDLLLNAPLPLISGFPSRMINAGKTNNKGIEVSITSHNINKKNFSWTTSLNLSHNKNTVKELYMSDYMEILSNWAQTSEFNKGDYMIQVGQSLGQMWGYELEGIYTTDDFTFNPTKNKYEVKEGVAYDPSRYPKPGFWKYKDVKKDNIINLEDRKVIGNAIPDIYGGLNNSFAYKGFDFSIFINFSIGNDIYSANKMYYTKLNNQYRNSLSIAKNRYTIIDANGNDIFTDPVQLAAANTNSTFASVEGSSVLDFHSGYVEDGSFLKINNISFGYTLPKSMVNKIHFSNIRFYGTLYNLYTFTKYSGFDPEVNTVPNNGMTPGIDWGAYPSTISFILGANISF